MLIIRDITMGRSYTFGVDHAGYAQALTQIDAINALGHVAGGDTYKVLQYFGRV